MVKRDASKLLKEDVVVIRLDTYLETVTSVDFYGPEVLDVLRIKEHEAGNAFLLVAFQRIASQYNPLEDDFQWVRWHCYTGRSNDVDTI